MKIDLSQFREVFLIESTDHLTSMEADLLQLRGRNGDVELMNAIFRAAHSIKGGAGSFGLTALVQLTHMLESLLDQLRSLELSVTEEIVEILLQSVDVLRGMLQSPSPDEMPPAAQSLMDGLSRIVREGHPLDPQEHLREAAAPVVCVRPREEAAVLCRVQFRPERELFLSGCNPLLLLRELSTLGAVQTCTLHTDDLPPLPELDPELCYLRWTVELLTTCTAAEVREVFEFVEHLADISVDVLPAAVTAPVREAEQSILQPTQPQTAAKRPVAGSESSSIRVSTHKVDQLIDLVGELVIAHAMTEQMVEHASTAGLQQLRQTLANMERNMRELHERVMSIRMMPVGSLFQRYTRTVYDIARSTGKNIELVLSGEETEVDKSMLELLGDPLTHLVRNAADHGIESAETRRAHGKPEKGRIALSASHRAGRVVIEICDDGAGIDPGRVRAKAVQRGLIAADAQLTDEQLRMLIFEPGFSTRDEVSDLSGRGVGMDVVKRNIQSLNGSVTLSSEAGRGSTIRIELPLTLAILEGLLVRVGEHRLVLPLLSVVETVSEGSGQTIRIAEGAESIVLRGEPIALFQPGTSARPACEADAQMLTPRNRLIVIVESERRKRGLVVDELLGQQQFVIKSLERHLHKVEGLMGATILGDGCVAPIVDVASLTSLQLSPSTKRADAGSPGLLSREAA